MLCGVLLQSVHHFETEKIREKNGTTEKCVRPRVRNIVKSVHNVFSNKFRWGSLSLIITFLNNLSKKL